jgi:hypothetical protein
MAKKTLSATVMDLTKVLTTTDADELLKMVREMPSGARWYLKPDGIMLDKLFWKAPNSALLRLDDLIANARLRAVQDILQGPIGPF